MRRFLLALLPITLLTSGCTAVGYDMIETASISPRFEDTKPIDFGERNPHRHAVHGIDVSKWNGEIDWFQVRRSGVSFAFLKATEGKDVVDPTFHTNRQAAAAARLPNAPYHFFYWCSTADEQADWFIANVPKEAMTMPPVLDVEWNHDSKSCTYKPVPAAVRAQMQRFMDRIEAHYGKRPIIYTTVDFHADNLVDQFKDYYFWVRSTASHPSDKYDERRWAFWQYTATGSIPGIKGHTDINVFAGDARNWQRWLTAMNK